MRARYRPDIRKLPPADPEANPSSARPSDEARREALLGLPPTADVSGEVTALEEAISMLPQKTLPAYAVSVAATRRRIERILVEDWQPLLARCIERDQLAGDRPIGCWCLGLGGRGEQWIPIRDEDSGTAYLRTFDEYCDCPDGQEAKAVAERMGEHGREAQGSPERGEARKRSS
jgi:hypothetical protein